MGELTQLLVTSVRLLLFGNTIVRILTLLVIGVLVAAIVISERKMADAAFRAVLIQNETDILHIVARNAALPKNVRNQLRSFETPDELYDYIYKKYDEPLYHRVFLHLSNAAPSEFSYDKAVGHTENLAALSAQLSKP